MKTLRKILGTARKNSILIGICAITAIIMNLSSLVMPQIVRSLTAALTSEGGIDMGLIQKLTIILICAYLLRAVLRFVTNYVSHVAGWHTVETMRKRCYEHLQKMSLRYFHNRSTGELLTMCIENTSSFEVFIAHTIPDFITSIVIMVGVLAMLFTINVHLALLTLIPVPLIFFASFYHTKVILKTFRRARIHNAQLYSAVSDNIGGIKEIQSFNKENDENKRIGKITENHTAALLHALKLSSVYHPSIELFASAGTAIVIFFGGIMAMNYNLSVSDITAFLLYLSMFYTPISTISRIAEDAQQAIANGEKVFEILDQKVEITDSPTAYPLENVKGNIEFKDVYFSYEQGNQTLKDVSFSAKQGEMLALIGTTGAGKSTIVNLLVRFYEATSSKITIDGTDINEVTLASLRQNVALVLQDVYLFNGTIAENIAYSKPNATREEIEEAAKIARAHEFIVAKENGYDTIIGERGVKLSGGQKQRLSIARAVLKGSPILILDEATSSVDVETEAEIQKAINNLIGTCTIIVIAHRLSTIRRANKILVLENGEIIQSGTHKTLSNEDGVYKNMTQSNDEV